MGPCNVAVGTAVGSGSSLAAPEEQLYHQHHEGIPCLPSRSLQVSSCIEYVTLHGGRMRVLCSRDAFQMLSAAWLVINNIGGHDDHQLHSLTAHMTHMYGGCYVMTWTNNKHILPKQATLILQCMLMCNYCCWVQTGGEGGPPWQAAHNRACRG